MQLFFDLFLFAFLSAILRFLIAPVSRDASLGDLIHLLRTDLHLEDIAILADDRRVQRLIHVHLRHRDIIFETTGDRAIFRVDIAKDLITADLSIRDDADGQQI